MKERIIPYKGKGIKVLFSVDRCTHVAECIRGLPKVFDSQRRPWIEPDSASPDKVAEVVMRCPTGALHFRRMDGGTAEPIPQENIMTVEPDGPVYIRGDIEILTSNRELIRHDTRVAFCRCGASKIKPYCDGTHEAIDFRDSGEIHIERKPLKEINQNGKLIVTIKSDGPLLLNGPLKFKDGDGTVINLGNRNTICRCGGSKKMPFCDGTHVRIGFSTEADT
jgi:CDGSH-type Zn-finger protein/uncharacterized Fe-S cluster protein YjdI